MSWRADFKEDIECYRHLDGGGALKQMLLEQGLWALLQYRAHHALYRAAWPGLLKTPLHWGLILSGKAIEVLTGISLPCTAEIGAGLHLPHCGGRIVSARAVIGRGCCLTQGVTLGVSGRGMQRGHPTLGDRVYVGVNAVVAGRIRIGNDVLIGANSLVNRDVPDHSTVVGVPATVVSSHGSEDYLAPKTLHQADDTSKAAAPIH